MIHITLLAPYADLVPVVKSVFADHPRSAELSPHIIPHRKSQPWTVAELESADVVIARGFAARKLARLPRILNVELPVTGYDVLEAVLDCIRRYGARKIGVVGTHSMVNGAEVIARAMPGVAIVCHVLDEEEQLDEGLRHLAARGCDAMLGGRSAYNLAQRMGLPCVYLRTGKDAVRRAVDEALRTVDVYRAEKRRSNSLAAIMDYTMEGIIATDPEGRITMINQFAQSFCSRGGEAPVGRRVQQYFPGLPLQRLIKTAQPLVDEVYMLGEAMLVMNLVPLMEESAITGYVITFQRGPQIQEMEDKIRKRLNPKGFVARYRFDDILGGTGEIREAKKLARQFAKSDANILIMGETGCGKEYFAQGIHNASARSGGPFVAVNCAALPEQLLESELFGYVEGAFTGATRGGKMGLFELAHNGSIFLDEIGDIAPILQARLLRVIQEREIIRLGHDRITPINVRIISATNKDLFAQVAANAFRSDLLYRLEVLKLDIPPLRARKEDIQVIAESFFREMRQGRQTGVARLDKPALQLMRRLDWPGNIRELRNFCERLAVLAEGRVAGEADVLRAIGARSFLVQPPEAPAAASRGEREREEIVRLLSIHRGRRKPVAAALGINASTLWRKMKRLGIE